MLYIGIFSKTSFHKITLSFTNIIKTKHFVYILNDTGIITKLPYIGIFKHSLSTNIFKDKHFVYILNNTRIIKKLPYICIFKTYFQTLSFNKYFLNKHFVYILNDTSIITKLPHLGIFKIFANIHKPKAFQSELAIKSRI